jgi:hypothetical protein
MHYSVIKLLQKKFWDGIGRLLQARREDSRERRVLILEKKTV